MSQQMHRYSGLNQLRLSLFRRQPARGRQKKSLLDPTSDNPPVYNGTKNMHVTFLCEKESVVTCRCVLPFRKIEE